MKSTTLLTPVIVAFALGMGFAYALSAYFLAWEYSPEAVEALSALGVFLTPIVALWIFTRWRQQRHSQTIMDKVIHAKEALLDYQFGIGDYANVVLSNKKRFIDDNINELDWAQREFSSKRGSAQEELFQKYSRANAEICKVLDLQSLLHRGEKFIPIKSDGISANYVFDAVDEYQKRLENGEVIDLKVVLKEIMGKFNCQFNSLNDNLELIYKKG